MNLKTKLLLAIGIILTLGFIVIEYSFYASIKKQAEKNLYNQAERIRNVLMATRRIYHQQFLASEIGLTPKTLGFLPAHAMNRISKDFAENWDQSGFTFNNISDRPRNPNQAADKNELMIMQYFRENPNKTIYFAPFSKQNGNVFYIYARPIWVEEYCHKCHGPRNMAPPTIKEAYDTGFDYKVGDLRGLISIKLPATAIYTIAWENFKGNFFIHAFIFILIFLLVNQIINTYFNTPLSKLVNHMQNLSHDKKNNHISGLKGEFAVLGRTFNKMYDKITSHQSKLAESEEKFRALAENSPDIIMRLDRELRHLYVNKSIVDYTGISQEDFLGKTPREIGFPRERIKKWEDSIAQVFATAKPLEVHLEMGTVKGIVVMDWKMAPELSHYGKVETVLCTSHDVTERRYLEDQVRHAQKMEAVGQLAGGIAHDFNNILTSIQGYANLLCRKAPPDSEVEEAAKSIEIGSKQASELTKQLLGFARKGKDRNIPIDIKYVIEDVIKLLKRTIDKRIKVIEDFMAGHRVVQGDPDQIVQVLLNLTINARDAMPDGGELVISTDEVLLDDEYCSFNSELTPGRHLKISISDTGCGIPKEIQSNIFEPFFTTKERGTGMGLATVYGIVKNHNGLVQVSSNTDQGTTFVVYLPLLEQSIAEDLWDINVVIPPHVGGTVLVIDDEEIVRNFVARMLDQLGYKIILAASGKEGLTSFKEHHNNIDLVILDIVMPESDGMDCFDGLKKIDPKVKLIITTGYTSDGRVRDILDRGAHCFIQKPYTIDELSKSMAEIMNSTEDYMI